MKITMIGGGVGDIALALHASYDHHTVTFLQQSGVNPTWLTLADLAITGNSHHLR